ncbi:MAG: hypothetical protein IKT52_10545 [Oscillospiraceae bacterium]|nr:hypothetical protein [Oscillospiraceae bacterium]
MSKSKSNLDDLEFKIEIATQTLERNIGFVSNCDNKTSIVLTAFGVLFTILLSDDGIQNLYSIISACLTELSFTNFVYFILLMISIIVTIIGIIKLGRILIPNTSATYSTLIFFSGIQEEKNHTKYYNRFCSMTQEDLLQDLTREIYENAAIATKKYEQYTSGFKFSTIGFAMFMIVYILGVVIY